MSLFSSFRKKPAPDLESSDKPYSVSKRRVTLGWSLSAKRRHSVPWDLRKLKSGVNNDLEDNTLDPIESSTYPAYKFTNLAEETPNLSLVREEDAQEVKINARGRSPQLMKTFPSLHLRSRSRSRSRSRNSSSSPTRNFLSRAAEAIRAPATLFYKDHVGEDTVKPLIQESSPARSLRSKKSVHFLMDDERLRPTSKSPPITTPGRVPPSLPPVHVSPPTFMDIPSESISAQTGGPPEKPSIRSLIAKAIDFTNDDSLLGPPAIPATEHVQHSIPGQNLQPSTNPFDDGAASDCSLPFAEPYILNVIRFQNDQCTDPSFSSDTTSIGSVEVHASSNFESNDAGLNSLNPFNDANCLSSDGGGDETSDQTTKGGSSEGSDKTGTNLKATVIPKPVNMPLRLKPTTNLSGDSADGVSVAQDLNHNCDPGKFLSTRNQTGEDWVTSDPCESAKIFHKGPISNTHISRQSPLDSESTSSHPDQNIEDCTAMLDRMNLDDTSPQVTMTPESKCVSALDDDTTTTVKSVSRSTSQSPTRRPFRFKNKTETSSSNQQDGSETAVDGSEDDSSPPKRGEMVPVPRTIPQSETWTTISVSDQVFVLLYFIKYPKEDVRPANWPWPMSAPEAETRALHEMSWNCDTYRDQNGWSPYGEQRSDNCLNRRLRLMLGCYETHIDFRLKRLAKPGGLWKFYNRYNSWRACDCRVGEKIALKCEGPQKDTQALPVPLIGQMFCSAIYESEGQEGPHNIVGFYRSLMKLYEWYYKEHGLGDFQWDPIEIPEKVWKPGNRVGELNPKEQHEEFVDYLWHDKDRKNWGLCHILNYDSSDSEVEELPRTLPRMLGVGRGPLQVLMASDTEADEEEYGDEDGYGDENDYVGEDGYNSSEL